MKTLHWEVNPITVLISNAVYENGAPVAHAKFENTLSFASTDDSGWFQIEIANREPLLLSIDSQPICKINLPEFESEQGVAVLDQVICLPYEE